MSLEVSSLGKCISAVSFSKPILFIVNTSCQVVSFVRVIGAPPTLLTLLVHFGNITTST